MVRSVLTWLALTGMVAFFGCSKDASFVVSANGKKLTVEMIDRRAEMMEAYRAKCGYKLKPKLRKKFRKGLRSSYPKVFVSNVVLKDYMLAEGLSVPADHLEKIRQQALKSFKGKRPKSWAAALSAMGDLADDFDDQISCEARRTFLADYWVSQNPTNVTAEVIAEDYRRIDAVNAMAADTNRVAHVRGTNAWERLKAGADFRKTAKEFSDLKQERDDGGDWAKLEWQQMAGDPELIKYARKLNPGEFSPPIEADNGLMILRVDEKDEKECKMSRIFFQLALLYKKPPEKEIVANIEKKHRDGEFRRRYDELLKKADVVWGDQKASVKISNKNKANKKGER